MTVTDGFVVRHGLVRYRPYQLRKYSREGVCEICGRPPCGKPMLLFDHCHTHGWIRGLICNGCSDQVGFIENGWNRSLCKIVLSQFPEYRLNCLDCRISEAKSAT